MKTYWCIFCHEPTKSFAYTGSSHLSKWISVCALWLLGMTCLFPPDVRAGHVGTSITEQIVEIGVLSEALPSRALVCDA